MKMNDFADAVKNKPNQTQLQTSRPIFQNFPQKPLFPNFFLFFLFSFPFYLFPFALYLAPIPYTLHAIH
jgi:hypothetical protein